MHTWGLFTEITTLHSLNRASGIRALKRDNFDVHDVCRISGHKNPNNLRHYHAPTKMDKLRQAMSIQHGNKTIDTGVYKRDNCKLLIDSYRGQLENVCLLTVARSSVIIRFVLTNWEAPIGSFDQIRGSHWPIWSKRNGQWLMNVLVVILLDKTVSVG